MAMLAFLTAFPLLTALFLLVCKRDNQRDPIVIVSAAVIAVTAIASAAAFLNNPTSFSVPADVSLAGNFIAVGIDLLLCGVVLVYAVRWRSAVAIALGSVQFAASVWCGSLATASEDIFAAPVYVDNLTLVMVLIVGVVGSAICVYALGYMKDFQAHEDEQASRDGREPDDRRNRFMALMFLFLSAMFVIVLSDNMDWILAGWEITTVCSFLMIGYTRTPEARRSALLQINLNMVGGLAFHVAVIFLHQVHVPLSISGLAYVAASEDAALLVLPLMLLSVAGLTKAAQMPFHRWLLGAMVAPTPTSALLHSSTMVKAGVFLLVKLAPLYLVYPAASLTVVGIGGITFLLCSLMAISQSNAKRVLAYSTIANLGLITACAGLGTPEAVWAAIFLIIFHTVSKSLLFLCVGAVEHRIGSRDIEDMDGLYGRLPRLTRCMMLGIMGMFVAPFGLLVSKWATLVSFAETGNAVFLIFLAFGSAATFFFWAKWLGKLAGVPQAVKNVEDGVHRTERVAVGTVAILLLACCAAIPVLSHAVVGPYLTAVYGAEPQLIGAGNLAIMAVCAVLVGIVLFAPLGRAVGSHRVSAYLGGQGIDPDARRYLGSMQRVMTSTKRNWYLADAFGERMLTRAGVGVSTAVLVMGLAACFTFNLGVLSGGTPLADRAVLLVGPGLPGIAAGTAAFGIAAPVLGCLLDGLDRKVSARMQGRVGPRLLQPYWDVRKLLAKERATVNGVDDAYVTCALAFCAVAGGLFVSGSNLLMCVFMVTLATLFTVLAAYSARSPYADMGADRECLQVMSYEPMLLIMAVGFFAATGSFDVARLPDLPAPIAVSLAPIFLGVLFILTIKLRKSPFDLSYSHHAHQEIVKGVTTEMSGRTLAKIEVLHWCESVLFLMWVGMFFIWANPVSWVVAVVVVAAVWLLEVLIDNNFARVKWQRCLTLAWIVALAAGAVNLFPMLVTPFF